MTTNSILLRRKSKFVLRKGSSVLRPELLAALLKNISALGYTLSADLQERVLTLSEAEAGAFHDELVSELRVLLGAHVQYQPMYPNFPKQVMEASEGELYLNAVMHYLGDVLGLRILPKYKKEQREGLKDEVKLKVIELGKASEVSDIVRNLIAAKTSISASDKADIDWFIEHQPKRVLSVLPETVAMKENVAFVLASIAKHTSFVRQIAAKYLKTASDVLRVAVAMSDGDVSLAVPCKFRNFKRAERRFLLEQLESCPQICEDMIRHKNIWLRLGERLHPFEYGEQFPKVYEAFDILRNNKAFETYNSKIEKGIARKDVPYLLNLLKSRPGELARRLDLLLRIGKDSESVLTAFQAVSAAVSSPVLLQVMTHFRNRPLPKKRFLKFISNHTQEQYSWGFVPSAKKQKLKETYIEGLRVFFPKGEVAKAIAIEDKLPAINSNTCNAIADICRRTLAERYAQLSPLGKVYIDPQLSTYTLPFSQRSASKALVSLSRGSKIPLDNQGNTLRFFIWWKEGMVRGQATGSVDIDLSAVMYDSDWRYLEHVSYTNLKSQKYQAVHSGDITSAPDGASEFIDIDMPSVLNYGGRYIVMNIYSFSYQPFCDLPECFAGWMIRQSPQSGEIYEPSTVRNKLDIAANSRIAIPMIIDLEERMVIWCDLALKSEPIYLNNVETNDRGIVLMGKAMTSLRKTSLYDLFSIHAEARGELCDTASEADTVFAVHEGIKPTDTDRIIAEFM